jgi:hypothetical protein
VIGCKLFLFWYQFVLLLRRIGWKGLIGHPKGKDNLISNSLQPRENDTSHFKSKSVLLKWPYLEILILDEDNLVALKILFKDLEIYISRRFLNSNIY